MLSRLLPKPSHVRALTLISSKLHHHHHPQPQPSPASEFPTSRFSARFFSSSSNGGDNEGDNWNFSGDKSFDPFFPAGDGDSSLGGAGDGDGDDGLDDDVFRPWSPSVEDVPKDEVFEIPEDDDTESAMAAREAEIARDEEASRLKALSLQREEQALTEILEGPKRAFGDLITASGITDEMINSLIALKDFEGVEGLPPLKELDALKGEKGKKKSSEAEKERLKLEEASKVRVRQVDDQGRACGIGRRKTSFAKVWIQPGDGKFVVNDRDLDVYFPIIDYRAALLRPFSQTNTLGLWDVRCSVKGGGVTGQAGAILLGISRALQNWEPDLRPPLKAAGFLTRDPRAVERKKPGKAKARKSYQWVKR